MRPTEAGCPNMNDTEFAGITAEARMLLAENRFNNSRDFYEEHKEKIKSMTTLPARQLACLMGDVLTEIDGEMETNPVKMVSRIRRDTRYSHDKTLYRENMWIMFMRSKKLWSNQPCMWFEFHPGDYSYGVGTFRTDSAFMEYFRKKLMSEPERFRQALKSVKKVGAVPEVEGRYKKDKYAGYPEDLADYANCRGMYFIRTCEDMERIADNRIVDELRNGLKCFAPMYRFLLEVMEDTIQY